MKKKYYAPLVLIGGLCIFSIFPLLNYTIDYWRVLHHDYEKAYRGTPTNVSFLKMVYLLDNKNKYDTLFMGSSRSGYLDARLVSKRAYNMKYNFGVAGIHLHNLKVLLANHVTIKNLWLGINDYVIWKDPKDHEFDYQRKTYKNDFIGKLDFYRFYLFRKFNKRDLSILQKELELRRNYEVTDPDKTYLKTAREREKRIIDHPILWVEKIQKQRLPLLGYNDSEYRINKAINEIKEIKKLCDEHHIKLTVFTYPSFYKTYLFYNQTKMEEFKRKLASVVDFYDFYDLNSISFDELNWIDTSHFTLSIGNYMIENIQKNNFLVTKETIDSRILKTRKSIYNLLHKVSNEIYRFNVNIDIGLKSFNKIFDLKTKHYKYSQNSYFILDKENNSMNMTVKQKDQMLILNPTDLKSKNVVLSYSVESPHKTAFQIFYKKKKNSIYNEKDSYIVYIEKGITQFNLLIPSKYLNNELRIDLANNSGNYKIKDLSIYEVG